LIHPCYLYFLNNPGTVESISGKDAYGTTYEGNPWVQGTTDEPQITPVEETIYYEDVTTPGRLAGTEAYGISLHKSLTTRTAASLSFQKVST
jgi:hypothetical protein